MGRHAFRRRPLRGTLPLYLVAALACAHAGEVQRHDGPASVVSAPLETGAQGGPASEKPLSPSPFAESAPAAIAPPAERAPDCRGPDRPSLRWPVRGRVTSGFGTRDGRHRGIDIAGYHGQGVLAAAAGTVVYAETKGGYGRLVILEHPGGVETVYAHNQDLFVLKGARVQQGHMIGEIGSTGRSSGPHLHFEVRVGGRPVDPRACLPDRPSR